MKRVACLVALLGPLSASGCAALPAARAPQAGASSAAQVSPTASLISPAPTASTPPPSGSPAAASVTPVASPVPSATAAATAHGEEGPLGGIGIGPYTGLKDWARGAKGIALVRVVAVGPVQWSTPDGSRPSEAELEADWSSFKDTLFIGTPYTLELVRVIEGGWTPAQPRTVWWLWGGRVGLDSTPPIGFPGDWPSPPQKGQLGMAWIGPPDPLFAVSELWPVDASGRLRTRDPNEHVTLADIAQHLR